MNSSDAIGGYFELELATRSSFLHHGALALNSGRHSFEYLLRALCPSRVHLPFFTCDVMFEPLDRLSIPYTLYTITSQLEIAQPPVLKPGELLVYTNYFGLKDAYARRLSDQYQGSLILDASQAFYFPPPTAAHTFYSPRKFFGLPDGGLLYTSAKLPGSLPPSSSYQRTSHLLKRIDLGPEAGYADFGVNDAALSTAPLSQMSPLTHRLLTSLDTAATKSRRMANYRWLHRRLGRDNLFPASAKTACPMVYPLLSHKKDLRPKLLAERIFIPTYWPNVLTQAAPDQLEHQLAAGLLPLPIDQRYTPAQLDRIVRVIHES